MVVRKNRKELKKKKTQGGFLAMSNLKENERERERARVGRERVRKSVSARDARNCFILKDHLQNFGDGGGGDQRLTSILICVRRREKRGFKPTRF